MHLFLSFRLLLFAVAESYVFLQLPKISRRFKLHDESVR